MSSQQELLIEKYKTRGILIDSNLALLYLVGSFDLQLVGGGKYKKLTKYNREDYHLLLRLKNVFKKSVTTPHALTEVSNLANDLPEKTRSACLKKFYETFLEIEELSVPSMDAVQRPEFHFLGLTDSVLELVSGLFLIVTDDARLVQKMSEAGLDALNFSHLRGHLLSP